MIGTEFTTVLSMDVTFRKETECKHLNSIVYRWGREPVDKNKV